MTENTPVPGRPGDEPLDEATQRALASMLGDTSPVDPQTRRRHLDAAMAEFDVINAGSTPGAQVIDLGTKRQARQRRTRLVGAAAAVVLVVGVGAKVASNDGSFGGSDDMATAAIAETSADASKSDPGSAAEVEADASGRDVTHETPAGSAQAPNPPTITDEVDDPAASGSTDVGPVGNEDDGGTTPTSTAALETIPSEVQAFGLEESAQVGAYVNQRITQWFELRNGHLRP